MNGIRVATEYAQHGVNQRIEEMLAALALDGDADLARALAEEP
jgi:hypothetical protein